MKLKRINQTAVALLTAAALAAQPAYSTGIPTFDGGSFIGAIQQLMNWQERFKSLIRDELSEITGMKQFLDARQKAQIENMFKQREEQCKRLNKNNSASAELCLNTVLLERQKYQLLEHMNKEITNEFRKINGIISKHGSLTKQSRELPAMQGFGGKQGMAAVSVPSSSGKAESAEQNVQAQLMALTNKIRHYEVQIAQLDKTIEQLKWARKQLTKDQLSGNTGLSAGLSKGAAATALEIKAQKWRTDARNNRDKQHRPF